MGEVLTSAPDINEHLESLERGACINALIQADGDDKTVNDLVQETKTEKINAYREPQFLYLDDNRRIRIRNTFGDFWRPLLEVRSNGGWSKEGVIMKVGDIDS